MNFARNISKGKTSVMNELLILSPQEKRRPLSVFKKVFKRGPQSQGTYPKVEGIQ
jgi:hypothetical protein